MRKVKRDTTELRRGIANTEKLVPGKPIAANISPLELRKLRNYVRYTTSLISTKGKVKEQMGPIWAANFEERIIYWRPTMSFPPNSMLTPEDVMFLVAHEAGHLNYTGGWNVPSGWSPSKTVAFKTFLNAVEDIRIERLQAKEFPGFASVREKVNRKFLRNHIGSVKEYAEHDQAGFRFLSLEANDPIEITSVVQRIADAEWPAVSRMCNLPSTKNLADAIAPLFDRLYKKTEEELANDANNAEGNGGPPDENGNPTPGGTGPIDPNGYPSEPSDNPWKSEMGSGQEPLTAKDLIEILKEGARGAGKENLKRLEDLEKALEAMARQSQDMIGGHEAGEGDPALSTGTSLWFQTRDQLKTEIGSLTRQFKSVLTTNRANNWREGQRRGQFNSRRARKAVAGDNRIFRKRAEIGEHDYTVAIAVDCSGSMNEGDDRTGAQKSEQALRATVLLTEAANNAGLRTIVVPFATHCKRVKGAYTPLTDSVRDDLGVDIGRPNGGTNECSSLIAAQDELAKVPMSRRILFVISDGETSDQGGAASIVHEIREMGVPTVALALGLDDTALPHHAFVAHMDDATEMLHTIPRLINEMIMHKGAH